MNVMIAATSGGFTDMLHDTGDTFGWKPWLFLSQVISFAIVAFLLRRFAYKPILAVLEDRRRRIEEGLINADKIKKELAEAEKRYQEIVGKANAAAQKIIDKARESAALEHERTMESMKRELGRLVVETTAKVTGKVLTSEDQKRLQEETARQLA